MTQTVRGMAHLVVAALLILADSARAGQVISATNQLGTVPLTPSWAAAPGSLISGLAPTVANGNFGEYTGGNANHLTQPGMPLTIHANSDVQTNMEAGGSDGTSGSSLVYTVPASTYGYNLTNVTVYGGWPDTGRDAQDYTVYYSMVANPGSFMLLASVSYLPSNPSATGDATRVVIKDAAGGVMASNVAALKFDFTTPDGGNRENGAAGYTAITVQGTQATNLIVPPILVTTSNQNSNASFTPTWPIETNSLIAGRLPSAVGPGSFACEAGVTGVSALTDGTFGPAGNRVSYATCGALAGQSVTYSLGGASVTNIVVYSGWLDQNRDGQFYNISYSTTSAPSTFIPLTSVYYNPPVTGVSANRVAISSSTGTPLATNVAFITFDFTPQDSGTDYGYSGYAEIILQGTARVAALTNAPATNVQARSATLGGQVTLIGGATPAITLFYGPTDGGTNAALWAQNTPLGLQQGSFTQAVTGLTPNTVYYFRARAVNSAGTNWAQPSGTFSTLALTLPVVTNLPASDVQGTFATLNGQIISPGGEVPAVIFYYGTADAATNPAVWAHSVLLGQQAGSFAQLVAGLSTNTLYYFAAAATNSAGTAWAQPSQTFTTAATNVPSTAVAVLTHHNDLARTGMNLNETVLNVTNVNTNQFGLLYTRPVDDQIYAQPLVMTNVNMLGRGVHSLVIVATVNDSVYAFDADDPSVMSPYWQTSFINPPNIVAPANTDMSALGACGGAYQDFSGNIGIVGTPVIDPVAGTIYLVARTKEYGNFVQRLHALDVSTGAERSNSPVVITATYAGTGDGSVGGVIFFDPARQNQRPGLALVNGTVYIGWSSHCDNGPYHGWIIGYDQATLQRVAVYNDTPNGGDGGIWMSGQAPAADTNGNLYLAVGNGTVDTAGGPDRGESFLKLTRSGTNLNIASWFTPHNWQDLENGDIDLGSGGLLLIPGTTLAFAGGKQGVMYLVNRDNMGGLSTSTTNDNNIVQSFSVTSDEVHGGAVWWDGPGVSYGYLWPSSVYLQQYVFNRGTGKFTLPAFAQSPSSAPGGQPGGLLALSANGTNAGSAIVWAAVQLTGDANQSVRPGILHAYDAQNVNHELWNSEQVSARDSVGSFAKFVPPTVANGKVYLATFSGQLDVYGAAAGWVALPVISPNGGTFTNSVTVTVTDATPGAIIYYTLDGSTPTTNAFRYTVPLVLTNPAAIKAQGFLAGFQASGVAVAVFGGGTGLTGDYYSNQLRTFINPPTLTRTDATVNFNWGTGSPDPSISVDDFTVRWTGAVQPPFTETYTFYTTTDDGVRLWVNGQLLINEWVDQGATEWSGSIGLVAGQKYPITMEYYENGGSAEASLSWGSPSIAKAIIPQSQLYPTFPPGFNLTGTAFSNIGAFQLELTGLIGKNYILQTTTNLVNWTPLLTNTTTAIPFYLTDPGATNFPYRFYRAIQSP